MLINAKKKQNGFIYIKNETFFSFTFDIRVKYDLDIFSVRFFVY